MQLFLIRHGETEHNVAGLLAGVTDSVLTNHGVLQTQRLGKYLTETSGWRFTHIFASDLQRAYMTAGAIRKAQIDHLKNDAAVPNVVQLKILREQDFGSLELAPWASSKQDIENDRPSVGDADFKPRETKEAMNKRANEFIDDFIIPILAMESPDAEEVVAVVTHGLFLSALWRTLLARFLKSDVDAVPDVLAELGSRPFEHLGTWTNTGYLHLRLNSKLSTDNAESIEKAEVTLSEPGSPSPFHQNRLTIQMVNGRAHLSNLKRTRGGVGSATYDARQQNIEGFFKKPREAM